MFDFSLNKEPRTDLLRVIERIPWQAYMPYLQPPFFYSN
jgi:hypothetical protein